jgi:hypothetical protein
MTKPRTMLAAPLALALLAAPAFASEIRDRAGMFSPEAIKQAEATLDKAESQTGVPTIVETVESLGGRPIREVALADARASGIRGVFVLIAEKEKKLESISFESFLGDQRHEVIETVFAQQFKQGNRDAGLVKGAGAIANALKQSGGLPSKGRAAAPPARVPNRRGGSSGLGVLLVIGGVILVVLFLTRLFANRGGQYGAPGQPGGPMGRPGLGAGGYGPGGYGGYGGRGGFWQGMLGGLGGALAGNWLYDQFSGRHHHDPGRDYASGFPQGGGSIEPTGGDWGGGDAGGTSWGDAGGGTSWGDVADAGGGGDWGGGGGDWGGGDAGGGDWT